MAAGTLRMVFRAWYFFHSVISGLLFAIGNFRFTLLRLELCGSKRKFAPQLKVSSAIRVSRKPASYNHRHAKKIGEFWIFSKEFLFLFLLEVFLNTGYALHFPFFTSSNVFRFVSRILTRYHLDSIGDHHTLMSSYKLMQKYGIISMSSQEYIENLIDIVSFDEFFLKNCFFLAPTKITEFWTFCTSSIYASIKSQISQKDWS